MNDYIVKKMILYGQEVEVKVYPPRKVPDTGGLSVNPTGRASGSYVDVTVYGTPKIGGIRKRRKGDPEPED